ncbi:MAG: carboxypeptidase regulatory-like domain-containing protein, partial [Silvibacterium sp.]|nr:carboxypeptidase regulatory-like domain-containing protein [Silvibacterium sp.]
MKPVRLRTGLALLILLTGFLFSLRSGAQTVFGSIAGTIADATGAVVAGAKVQAVEEKTGTTLETVSTSTGAFRLPQVP